MPRTTYLQDMTASVREFASFDEAFDFMLAANRDGAGTWTIVAKLVAVAAAPCVAIDMTGWEAGRRFADSYERQSAWNAEYDARAAIARLDASLAEIAALTDITDRVAA